MIGAEGNIFIVVGLAYGDEGKGTITDYLAWKYGARYGFRFNGGVQAAHYVVTAEDVVHRFAQFSSGTFSGTRTALLKEVMVDPIEMVIEAEHLEGCGIKEPLGLVTIDPECLVITPFHAAINQMREIARGAGRRGSCGMGVGETARDGREMKGRALVAGDMFDKELLGHKLRYILALKTDMAEQLVQEDPENPELRKRLEFLKKKGFIDYLVETYHSFATQSGVRIDHIGEESWDGDGDIVCEGAQGILLDQQVGMIPFVTQSNTTPGNALRHIRASGTQKRVTVVGVTRAYATRHGHGGPFMTEDPQLAEIIPDMHNGTNRWQGDFRIGWFDALAIRYSLEASGGVDCLALTNFDRLSEIEEIKVCIAYIYEGEETDDLKEFFEYEEKIGAAVIRQIRYVPDRTAERQQRLASLLRSCKPLYAKIKKQDYVSYLEGKLGISISILSEGPKAADKKELRPLY